jgi:peptide/nickel transport system ATP-binding protein
VVDNLGVAMGGADRHRTLIGNVSFQVKRGDYFTLVGKSGSGRSITCHTVTRLLPFKPRLTGRVVILSPSALRNLRRKSVGMVFQDSRAASHTLLMAGASPTRRC